MKTEAYICDLCNELKLPDEVVGVSQQQDMFNKMEGFAIVPRPDREQIHLCTRCYEMKVTSVAEREHNRRYDERGYEMKVKEMSYLVRSQCVSNYTKKTMKKVCKGK